MTENSVEDSQPFFVLAKTVPLRREFFPFDKKLAIEVTSSGTNEDASDGRLGQQDSWVDNRGTDLSLLENHPDAGCGDEESPNGTPDARGM
ncbi:hypothetical protein C472_04153 [Halorubrum tebenquichense DSM 14210]|uniref:Uncharacterized protein n=1 Tax=Halorubrum tebenquichense DSM 14210 TaxID=1227485 RepID=M0DVD4_9EURY|nr:hypothetical protein C472_04153 [Halorubrum tebenquichense DSM 14210]